MPAMFLHGAFLSAVLFSFLASRAGFGAQMGVLEESSVSDMLYMMVPARFCNDRRVMLLGAGALNRRNRHSAGETNPEISNYLTKLAE